MQTTRTTVPTVTPTSVAPRSEWREGWPLVLAAGAALGASTVHYHSFGVMITPLADTFEWSRGEISAALLISSVGTILCGPIFGNLADRIGARRVGLTGLVLYAGSLASIGLSGPSLWTWYLAWAVFAIVHSMASGIIWSLGVASRFSAHRGTALDLMLSGSGLCIAVAPPLTFALLATYGWRAAYAALGAGILIFILPLAWRCFYDASDLRRRDGASTNSIAVNNTSDKHFSQTGLTIFDALRSAPFWQLGAAFFLAALAISTILIHLQPMLIDAGLPAAQAAGIAAAIGPALIVGRLLTGYLLDRVSPPLVSVAVVVLPIVCCMLLVQFDGSTAMALIIALLIGFATGAEGDLLAFLIARYFGLRNYGTIYGVLGGIFGVGMGLAPVVAGAAFDAVGTYVHVLWFNIACLAVSATLLGALGRHSAFETQQAPRAANALDARRGHD